MRDRVREGCTYLPLLYTYEGHYCRHKKCLGQVNSCTLFVLTAGDLSYRVEILEKEVKSSGDRVEELERAVKSLKSSIQASPDPK